MKLSDFDNTERFQFIKEVEFRDNSINTIPGIEYLDLTTGKIYQVAPSARRYRIAPDGNNFSSPLNCDPEN